MRARNERQQSWHYCLCTFSNCASPLIPQEALYISSSSLDFIPLDNCLNSKNCTKMVQKLFLKSTLCSAYFTLSPACSQAPPVNVQVLDWQEPFFYPLQISCCSLEAQSFIFFSHLFHRNAFQWNNILLNHSKNKLWPLPNFSW